MAEPEAHAIQTTFVDYVSPSLWETLNNHLTTYIEILTDRTGGFSDPERRKVREPNLNATFGILCGVVPARRTQQSYHDDTTRFRLQVDDIVYLGTEDALNVPDCIQKPTVSEHESTRLIPTLIGIPWDWACNVGREIASRSTLRLDRTFPKP